MSLFGRKPLPPLPRYGVDYPSAFASLNHHDVVVTEYHVTGAEAQTFAIQWNLLTGEQRLELDRLLWLARGMR